MMKKGSHFSLDIRTYGVIIALAVIWLGFTIFSKPGVNFLTAHNISNLFQQMSVTAILAIGMVMVIVSGNIDLSVGVAAGFCGAIGTSVVVYMFNIFPGAMVIGILMAILTGALVGFVTGLVVAYGRVPSFIVTLGSMMVFRGLLQIVIKATLAVPNNSFYYSIGNEFLTQRTGLILTIIAVLLVGSGVVRKRLVRQRYGFTVAPLHVTIAGLVFLACLLIGFTLLMNRHRGIPYSVILLIVLAIAMSFITTKTKFGRHVYAIGGNPEAAFLSGIKVKLHVVIVFVIMGLMIGFAGMVLTSRLGNATRDAGRFLELDAIAACVIGGTSLMGGVGSVPKAVLGALIMQSLNNGLSVNGAPEEYQLIIKGIVLIAAVGFDLATKRKQG
jgi:D-xylose transport system permease protein